MAGYGFASNSPYELSIQGLIDAGSVEQKILPGINSVGVNSLSAADSAAIGSTFGGAASAIHSVK
jgi:hypothetical protein